MSISYGFNPVQLIEEVKKRPALYKSDQITDREEKLGLWKEIGAVIYNDWSTCNKATVYDRVLELQRKWRSLKDAYNRELRGRRSGVRANKKVYRNFKIMKFLGGYEGIVSDTATDAEDDDDPMMEDSLNTDEIPEVAAVTLKKINIEKKRRKKKKRHISEESQPTEEIEMPMFPVELENESDSDRLFLLSFLPEMRQLPVNIKMWVRAQIANTMQEAVSCHYNNTNPGTSLNKSNLGVKRQRQESTELE